jgi:pilus assembly protein Flp/PilA
MLRITRPVLSWAWLRWRREEEGQTLVEYALLIALIALVVIAALILLGPIVSGFFSDMGDAL